jgi:hypothetical protein
LLGRSADDFDLFPVWSDDELGMELLDLVLRSAEDLSTMAESFDFSVSIDRSFLAFTSEFDLVAVFSRGRVDFEPVERISGEELGVLSALYPEESPSNFLLF